MRKPTLSGTVNRSSRGEDETKVGKQGREWKQRWWPLRWWLLLFICCSEKRNLHMQGCYQFVCIASDNLRCIHARNLLSVASHPRTQPAAIRINIRACCLRYFPLSPFPPFTLYIRSYTRTIQVIHTYIAQLTYIHTYIHTTVHIYIHTYIHTTINIYKYIDNSRNGPKITRFVICILLK